MFVFAWPMLVTRKAIVTVSPELRASDRIATDSPLHGAGAGLGEGTGRRMDCLAAGMAEAEILAEYPSLAAAGVRAAAAYGALLARDDLVPLLPQR